MRGLHAVGLWLQCLGVGVWVGGLLTIGAVVAPHAFRVLPSNLQAGAVVGGSLERFHLVAGICWVFTLAGSLLADRLHPASRPLLLARLALLLLLGGVLAYQARILTPRMDAIQTQAEVDETGRLTGPQAEEFDTLHRTYTRWTQALVWGGLLYLFLTIWPLTAGPRVEERARLLPDGFASSQEDADDPLQDP